MSFNITGDNPLYIDASDMDGKLKTMQRIMRKEQYEKLLYSVSYTHLTLPTTPYV